MSVHSDTQTAEWLGQSYSWSRYFAETASLTQEWAILIEEVAQLASEIVASSAASCR